jgi:hypothetical protein
MAKKSNTARVENGETTAPVTSTSKTSTPEGFEDVSSDIEAVYDYRHCKEVFVRPLHYTVSDSKDKKKPNILIHCDLVKPAVLVDMSDDSDDTTAREFPAGTRIGIWYRPGLRQLMQCAGSVTFISFEGDRDVGQIQPMKVFKVSRKKGSSAEQLLSSGDYRKVTRHMALPWEDASAVKQAPSQGNTQPAPNDDDDVPF